MTTGAARAGLLSAPGVTGRGAVVATPAGSRLPADPILPSASRPPATPAASARCRLPAARTSRTRAFSVGGASGYLTASVYPDGRLGEVFVVLGKHGSTLAGLMGAFSMCVSLSLQHGVPLETWVDKFINTRFEPAGLTDDPDIPRATSLVDYMFRRLALDHLAYRVRAPYGILTAAERAAINVTRTTTAE